MTLWISSSSPSSRSSISGCSSGNFPVSPSIALLGTLAIVATGRLTVQEAWLAIDTSTIALLFGLMVISAQFRLGGFYDEIVRRIAAHAARPEALLMAVVVAAGALSAVLANDIVCLAMAPMLIEACAQRRITPVPFLLALACAANAGSAATLIGNPQNMSSASRCGFRSRAICSTGLLRQSPV